MQTPIAFSNDGATLRGTFDAPDGPAGTKYPLVILSQGLGTLHQWARPTIDILVEGGFACLSWDYRGFGLSDGFPEQEANPWKLIHDLRSLIDYAHTRDDIDTSRIGLWGSCYGGGLSMVAAALDTRVATLFLQVPLTSGGGALKSFASPEAYEQIMGSINSDRVAIASGQPRTRLTQTALDPAVPAITYDTQTYDWMTDEARNRTPHWRNELTLATIDMMVEFEPGDYLPRFAPRPLMLIVADDDTITPAQFCLDAYEKVDGPKSIVHILGDHYCVYYDQFDLVSKTAKVWFTEQFMSA